MVEFRIKHHQAYVNGNTLLQEWWTVQRLFGFFWITAREAVPYSSLNKVIRFSCVVNAEDYIEEQLKKTRKVKIISEVI